MRKSEPELAQSAFLARLDEELGGGPRSWCDVAIVRNVGPLLTSAPLTGDRISNRGFNAIVFAPGGGAASHYLKVRPISHGGFKHEAEVTGVLSAHSRLGQLVPRSRAFVTGPARFLAQDFVDGRSLDALIRARRSGLWHDLAADVLLATEPLHAAIADMVPVRTAIDGGAPPLLSDLAALELLGLDAAVSARLRARLDAAELPVAPQHGDFWPRNVLRVPDGWRVIDFESCGQAVPLLFDVFHFIRGCCEAASGGRGIWISHWAAAGPMARRLAERARHAAGAMELATIEAALVAYEVRFAATLQRRGIARDRIAGRLHELQLLPGLLEGGVVRRLLE